MILEFANKNINEFKSGKLHFKNDGKSFEVDAAIGSELLKEKTTVEGESVLTFKEAVKKKEGK